MRIGLVRRGYSASGGAEAYLLRLAAELGLRGHELVLFSDVQWPDDALGRCTTRPEMVHAQARVAGAGKKSSLSPLAFADWLRVALKERTADFVLSMERIWECDAYRAGDGVHASWLQRRRQFEPVWRGWLRRFQRKHSDILKLERALFTGGARRIIANSQMVKDEITRQYGTPAEKISVIHNGVPLPTAEPGGRERMRAELGLSPGHYTALFAGTGWERKGLRNAIEAVNALASPATLIIAGRGRKSRLPSSDRVKFLGPVPQVRMRAVFAAADVFVLPTFYDPFSNACIEALAAGLPVITTTANGFSEIIEPGAEGEVVPPGDSAALAAAMTAWSDSAKRECIRARLLEKAAHFSVARNVEQTLEVITSAA